MKTSDSRTHGLSTGRLAEPNVARYAYIIAWFLIVCAIALATGVTRKVAPLAVSGVPEPCARALAIAGGATSGQQSGRAACG